MQIVTFRYNLYQTFLEKVEKIKKNSFKISSANIFTQHAED